MLTLDSAPVVTAVECRRYRCVCGCVMIVVPRELSRARRFTLVTIAIAVARFGNGLSATEIRRQLSAGSTLEEGWASLHRWNKAIREGRLFRWIRGVSELAGRGVAKRAAVVIAAASGLDTRQAGLEARVVAGVISSST